MPKFFLKDYFDILELTPSASYTDIKKAYRRLAQLCHPDKNPGDPYAATRFTEVKEAYEVLTDPRKKEAWLQQRWYDQSIGKKRTEGMVTPVSLLKLSLELERYVAKLDTFRMDRQGLQTYFLELLSDHTIEKLNAFAEPATNHQIIQTLLRPLHQLPPDLAAPVLAQLMKMAGTDERSLSEIVLAQKRLQRRHREDRFQPWIITGLTLLLCILIWWINRR